MDNTITSDLYSPEWCQYRLPCGICEKLQQQCLKMPSHTTITYSTQTTDQAITYKTCVSDNN